MNGSSRFLIQNLLNQLLCYADIKESWLFVAETVETLDLKSMEDSMDLQQFFHVWIDFNNKKEIS